MWIVELDDGGSAKREIRMDARPPLGMQLEAYRRIWIVDRIAVNAYVARAVPASSS
jgi:hypothetical protein